MNRRSFVSSSAAFAATPFLASSSSLGAQYGEFGDFKKRVALIGSGWYGKLDLLRLVQVAPIDVVGLCDADSQMLNGAADLVATRQLSKKRPPTFKDYQEMLDQEKPDIVLIDTPDHWHALPALAAIEAGADLYLQKPVSVDIAEGQTIFDAARKKGSVVQVGTQRRSTPHLQDAKEQVVDAGLLGEVGHAEICCYYHMRTRTPLAKAMAAVPDHLDWDLWTGPAPMRDYNSVVHPRGWRSFKEYGNGIVGDMCIHMLDTVRWMLELGEVNRVSSSGGIHVDTASIANIPDTQTATFVFDDLEVVWNHRTWGDAPDPEFPWALFIYGEKGTLKADVHKWEFTPRGKGKKLSGKVSLELDQYPEDEKEEGVEKHVVPAVRAHMRDLLSRIEDNPPQPPFTPLRSGPRAASEPSRQSKFLAVHGPIQTSPDLWEKYRKKATASGLTEERFKNDRTLPVRQVKDCPIYGGMMESMDDAVGIVTAHLEKLGLDKNTIVIFTSDNGGVSSGDAFATACLPLRGGKGRQWEGGIRQPYYIVAPGVTKPGSTSSQFATGTDFFPTLLDLAGLEQLPTQHVDGISLVPALKGGRSERVLYWHYPHYGNQGGEPSGIIRDGDYKLIRYYEDGHEELYNVKADLGETKDLATEHPELVKTLSAKLTAHLAEVGAKIPKPDPRFNAEKKVQQIKSLQTKKKAQLEKQHANFLQPGYQPNKTWWNSVQTKD